MQHERKLVAARTHAGRYRVAGSSSGPQCGPPAAVRFGDGVPAGDAG
jgi:hypothetical protein